MSDRSKTFDVIRRSGERGVGAKDDVAVEEPLEISLHDEPLAVVMRTPGDDEDLVLGFLISEGILVEPAEVAEIEVRDEGQVTVGLAPGIKVDPEQFRRNMFVSSSCGVCGKASIEMVQLVVPPTAPFEVSHGVVMGLTGALRDHQPTFDSTGGLHACALVDLEGRFLAVREDVGRHNAVDKVIGAVARNAWPLPPTLMVVSGRQSFEIVQKAAMARVRGVVGISAPSSLAIELAQSLGMLLVGFSRDGTFNVYSAPERITD